MYNIIAYSSIRDGLSNRSKIKREIVYIKRTSDSFYWATLIDSDCMDLINSEQSGLGSLPESSVTHFAICGDGN